MLSAAQYTLLLHRRVECASQLNNLTNRLSITTPSQRIVRFVVERNIEHRTEVEIESKESQQLARDFPWRFTSATSLRSRNC
jgi:hypothetical protein